MTDSKTALFENGYVYLPGFLDLQGCEQLTLAIKRLVAAGASTRDPQCDKSESVNSVPILDSLLEQLLPSFEEASGRKLFPTYAYARLYAPGEDLKVHIDRDACEISASITLGFSGKAWPIFMGDAEQATANKIEMDVGDAVLYMGVDKHHWREPYTEGDWQAQVFLHYVDADGPNAKWKYDKRKELAHHKKDFTCWQLTDAVSTQACDRLIESIEGKSDGEHASVGFGDETIVVKEIRDVRRVQLGVVRGVGATMSGIGLTANNETWKFNVTHSNQAEYLRYDVNGHYRAHVDTFIDPQAEETRKLTVLVFLNNDFEGGQFYIQNGGDKVYPYQKAGTAIVFPSFLVHGVEPVTKGVRRSVVTWMVGPWFK
tara:strand:+ start:2007 stop:3122 length:1116 start_codon:yes stop_codon:yes gene_type:complete